jgi:superfamily II DNA or RNA helicase
MKIHEERRKTQIEAVDALENNGFNGFVIAPTGIGKAWILIESLKRIKPKGRIWYLCDSEDNRDTTFRNELIKWGAEKWVDKIEFMCYQTAYKLSDEKVELGLFDEADMALTPEYSKGMTQNKFKYKVAVSATLEGSKRGLAKSIVPIVYEKELKEVEDAKLLNPAKHYLVNFMLSKKENEKYLNYNYRFGKLLMGNAHRNREALEFLQIQRKHFLSSLDTSRNVCRKLLKQLHKVEDNKIMVFCGLSDQADKICKYSYHAKSKENYLVPFHEGKIRVIAVVGKVDRGQNIDGINNIVFESPTKSPTKFTQKSGRGRRLAQHETLHIYYLIPYYVDRKGEVSPTIVKKWVYQATNKINFNPITFKFHD